MPLWTAVTPDRQRAVLRKRLRKLESVFSVPAWRGRRMDTHDVVQYFDHCHDAYRKYLSAEGAVHMALNDGDRFDADGFYGQARRIEQAWAAPGGQPPADVLEMAFGQGFNLAYLAGRHPGLRFSGIDLTPAHVRIAHDRMERAGLRNVSVAVGDFNALAHEDASFDQVFCIEAFCYAMDLPRAFGEVSRVLRPGGRFTLFDGYQHKPPAQATPDEALAVELIAKGMAIDRPQVLDDFLRQARAAGFEVEQVIDLDAEVMPSLRKLQRLTGAVIRFPWLGRRALAQRSMARGGNILAGYLMNDAVAMGLMCYRQIELRKR
jgi:ubiquinone/menaquinone biosynthesis C-methylase UbiE